MQPPAPGAHCGYFHEAAFYDSDEDLVAIVEPFLRDGRELGVPTLVTFAERNATLVRRALPDLEGVEFVDGGGQYRNPAQTIAEYHRRFTDLVADGAEQIRVVGDVPHPGVGVPWESWARYEATVNHHYDDFPLWGICPYDTRITPDFVLDEVRATHPHVASPDGMHHRNAAFDDPAAFLRRRRLTALGPDADGAPGLVLVDPTPHEARDAAVGAATDRLTDGSLQRMVLAISEIVTNAGRHGHPPVVLRLWPGEGRMVATVSDAGPGPANPCLGLLPADPDPLGGSGRGLWLAHHVCSDVGLAYEDGFTVRMLVDDTL